MERTLSLNAVPKKYDESFKRQAVEMVLQGGKTVKQVAEIPKKRRALSARGPRTVQVDRRNEE